MSSSLSWVPIVPRNDGESVSTGLKWILEKEFLDGHNKQVLDASSIPFLRGVMAASNKEDAKDLQQMMEAIKQHGAIEIWLQY